MKREIEAKLAYLAVQRGGVLAKAFKPRKERDRIIVAELGPVRAVIDSEQTTYGVQWHWTIERGDELLAWGKGRNENDSTQRARAAFTKAVQPNSALAA